MPRIPQAQAGRQLRVGQGISPSVAGAAGAALADLGQTVSSIGIEAMERKKRADDAAFVTETTNRILREETEKQADIETRGLDVDFEQINQDYQDRLNTALENAPSQDAANEVRLQADNMFSRKFFPGYSQHQSKLNVNRRVDSVTNALDDIQSEVLTGRTSISEAVARSEAAIVGLSETAGGVIDINKLRESTKDGIAFNHLSQRIQSGDSSRVINELKEGKWDALASSDTVRKMLSAAQSDLKARSAKARQEYAAGLDDYLAYLSAGNDSEELAQRYSPEKVNAMFGDKADKLNESITDARDFGKVMTDIKTASPDELRSLIEQQTPSAPENFSRESKQLDLIVRAVNARNKAIADDPAAYVASTSKLAEQSYIDIQEALSSNDPDLIKDATDAYVSIQRSMQEELGVPSKAVALLPESFAKQIAASMNDMSQGGESAVNTINSLQDAFGNEWRTVEKQLASNKMVGETAKIISMTPRGQGQTIVAEAMLIPEPEYKSFIGDDAVKDIKDNSLDVVSPLMETMRVGYGDSAIKVTNSIQTAIERTAMKLIADGSETDADDALESAFEIIMGDTEFFDTYRVPKAENPEDVDYGVGAIKTKILRGDIPVLAPPSSEVRNAEDALNIYLRSGAIYPITTNDGSGVAFIDSQNNVIRKPDGSPLEYTWSEVKREGYDE